MKKLLSGLMAASIISSSAATVVACGGGINTDPITGDKIWLVTDTGKVADKSFNQSGYEGGNYFNRNMLKIDSDINKTEPAELTDLQAAYENAKFDGAGTLILPGFHHAVEGQNMAADIMNGGTTIILDSDNAKKTNQIGIMFRGDISGFLAGFSSLVTIANDDTNLDTDIKMATYGGSHNAGAVDNFMVGYLASIEVYNAIVDNKDGLYSSTAVALGLDETEVKASRVESQKSAPKNDTDTSWFTNSFNAGGGKTISETLVANNADIIMPVAGPQTKDTLDVINSNESSSAKVIGVDTNQADQYAEANYLGKFLTSAEKSLVDATVISLGHSKLYIEKEGVQDETLAYANKKNASFTLEDEKGEFKSYDLDANKAETWEGKTLWMGGKASSGDKNIVTTETIDLVNQEIESSILETASINLFKEISTDGTAAHILSEEVISAYAQTILDSIKNPTA